jgi:membrane protease YdiL (CAAX protease family)
VTTSKPREPLPELDRHAPAATEFVPPAPTFPPHRWGFGAFLLVEAVLLASAAFVSVLLGPVAAGEPVPMRDVIIGTITPTMTAAAVALVITQLRGNGPVVDLRLAWRWEDVRTGLRFGLLGLVCTTVAAFLWAKIVGENNASSAIGALVNDQRMSVSAAVVMFLYVWLLGPICEELIYRGLLWSAAEQLFGGGEKWARAIAFLLSTAVFAASHLEPLRTTLLLVIAIPIGLARLVTGRLTASIVAHQVNNFLPALAILCSGLGLVVL